MIRARVDADLAPLHETAQRATSQRPAWRGVLAVWREQIASEFRAGRSADGVRWQPRQPVSDGNTGPLLQQSGLLLRTWLGGPGAVEDVSGRGLRFGVSTRRLPYATIHRTGGKILVTDRMRRKLAAIGRPLRAATREIVIPARPHASSNPEIRGRAATIFRTFLATGEAPQ